jgi:hypothetical protein
MSQAGKRDLISSSPLNVRNMIWSLLLVPNEHINICYSTTPSPFPDSQGNPWIPITKSQIPAPSILRVSKAIHAEAENILYCFNIFEFNKSSAMDDLMLFLQAASHRAYRTLIRHVIISWPLLPAKDFEYPIDFLIGCQGLKDLTIYGLPLGHDRIPKCIQLWMSGLRVEAVKFPDTSPHLVSELSNLIEGKAQEGKGRERTKRERKRAYEQRASKVICYKRDKTIAD